MKLKSVLMVGFGIFLCALSFNLFLIPHNIMPGGVSGISQILNSYITFNKSIFILVVSLILLIISFILLKKEHTKKSILGSILFPICSLIIEQLMEIYPVIIDNPLLCCIFGGIMMGFGMGLVYREGFTTGGTDIVIQILNKYLYLGMGLSHLIVEGTILLIGAFVFGFSTFMYSLIVIYLISYMIDKVMLGISNSKSFYIVTSNPKEVESFIINNLKHGVTIINGKGAYSKEKKHIILTAIPTSDYYKLKEGLKKIDPNAFFIVNDAYEVNGGV